MTTGYSVETCRRLEEAFREADVLRPLRVERYDTGAELTFEVTGVVPLRPARVTLRVEKFVGGGFAGQVYRVGITKIDAPAGELAGLAVGGTCAMKILIPPSRRAKLFRNAIYRLGFQGPFSLQANPAAARAGALWQKFIRRAAGLRFDTEKAVVDIIATFVDPTLGSCGELSEWVDGRTWRFEVDDRLDLLKRWRRGKAVDEARLGSGEYRAKKQFMGDFVELLHEMGAHEFARQYEWSTCKSQPNCLKRRDAGEEPAAGLTAVDFRAGLALLPCLPMSPGDFKLIGAGIARGSLVQFDRGDLGKLQQYVHANAEHFADMTGALDELAQAENDYRNSLPDITHNHVRLLYSRRLWGTMLRSAVTGWRVRNVIDDACATRLRRSRVLTLVFALLGMLGVLAAAGAAAGLIAAWSGGALSWPLAGWLAGLGVAGMLAGRLFRTIWGRADYRRHYARMLTCPSYLVRLFRGKRLEKLIAWHRDGRVGADRALALARRPWRFCCHLPLSILPAGLHRLLTDRAFTAEKLRYVFVRPVKLYFNADAREQWLRDMIAEGRRHHMLSDEDAAIIESQINEPFIQKYLKSLAVHVCTLPITQVVSVIMATYVALKYGKTPGEAWAMAGGILFAFQVVPISPGSLVRGLYVLYLVIRERDFRNYNIAVFLGFFKYIGYLAFPIQMAYHYPALARFMAGHWSTGAVHIVPVFGERGALLEHAVFSLFYNRPLTLRRRMRKRGQRRAKLPARLWHLAPCLIAATALLAGIDLLWVRAGWHLPALKQAWWAILFAPLFAGAASAVWAGSAPTLKRIALAALCGALTALTYAAIHTALAAGQAVQLTELFKALAWNAFFFTLTAAFGAIIAELTVFGNDYEPEEPVPSSPPQ